MADPSVDDGGGPAGDMAMPADSKYANFKLPDMGKSFEEKQEEARRVLTELYTAYAPKKLNDIPTLLEAYAGQEDELIASARLKYAKADQVYKKKRGFGKQGASSSSSDSGGGGGGGGGDGASAPAPPPPPGELPGGRRKSYVGRMGAKMLGAALAAKPKRSTSGAGAGGFGSGGGGGGGDAAAGRGPAHSQGNAGGMAGYGSAPKRRSSLAGRVAGAAAGVAKAGAIGSAKLAVRAAKGTAQVVRNKTGMLGGGARKPAGIGGGERGTRRESFGEGGGGAAPMVEEEFKLEIKCLDTGEAVRAGEVLTDLSAQNKGMKLRALKGRDKFIAFFEKYDPAKVNQVDQLLTHGGKTEDQLWYDLQVKYQVNQRQRLLQILHLFDAPKVKKVDAILDAHLGEEEIYIAALVAKYQPKLEQLEPDPKTWKTGAANTYQMLPEQDLGD